MECVRMILLQLVRHPGKMAAVRFLRMTDVQNLHMICWSVTSAYLTCKCRIISWGDSDLRPQGLQEIFCDEFTEPNS